MKERKRGSKKEATTSSEEKPLTITERINALGKEALECRLVLGNNPSTDDFIKKRRRLGEIITELAQLHLIRNRESPLRVGDTGGQDDLTPDTLSPNGINFDKRGSIRWDILDDL